MQHPEALLRIVSKSANDGKEAPQGVAPHDAALPAACYFL